MFAYYLYKPLAIIKILALNLTPIQSQHTERAGILTILGMNQNCIIRKSW